MPSPHPVRAPRALLVALVAGLLAATALALHAGPAGAQSESTLRDRIAEQRAREGSLSSTAKRLGALEARAARQVALIEGRLAEVQREYAAAKARAERTARERREARARLARLRAKLDRYRATLSRTLRAAYTTGRPDLFDVALASQGFADLLDRMAFLQRVNQSNTNVVGVVTELRDEVRTEERRLSRLLPKQREAATAAKRQRDAIQEMRNGLAARKAALGEARAARLQALSATRSSRRQAERALSRIEAKQAREARRQAAAAASAGGGGNPVSAGGPSPGSDGDWTIPWDVVQCESGGQNMTPNSAGASGYYQFMPQTWKGLGGSTKHAYQAPKSEQDRLARKLWAGGSGARNWDCYAMVR